MRQRRWLLAVIGAVAAVGSACSGSEDWVVAAGRLRGQQVLVAAVWTDQEQRNFEKVLERFERRTGAEVRFLPTGRDIATALSTRLEGGVTPDVAVLPQPGLLSDLVRRRALRSIEDVAGRLVDVNYDSEWRRLGSVDGTLYGVWFKAANKSMIWYRTKAFFDAGVAPPDTWDDLQGVARDLARSGRTPFALGARDGWTLTDWFENVYLRTAGPTRYDQLARHEIPWTDDSVKHALRTLAQVLGRPEWLAGGTEGSLSTTFEESVVRTFGEPSAAAMTFEGSFVSINIANDTDAKVGSDARFFDFPTIGGSPRSLVIGGDVAVMLKDSEASRELIRYLATPQAAEPWAEAGGFISPNRAVDPAAYPDVFARQLARALTQPAIVRFDLSDLVPASFGATTGQGMWRILQDWLRNPGDVDGTAARLEAAAVTAAP